MDTDDVLRILVHDIRSPLGVADGYLRLLADGRLKTPEERDEAMKAALRALRQIGTLCEYASACLDVSSPPSVPGIPAVHLCDRVAALVSDRLDTHKRRAPDGNVKVGAHLDRIAAAVASLIPSGSVGITRKDSALHFTGAADGAAPSLQQIAAGRAVEAVGGRVDRDPATGHVDVIFPLETPSA